MHSWMPVLVEILGQVLEKGIIHLLIRRSLEEQSKAIVRDLSQHLAFQRHKALEHVTPEGLHELLAEQEGCLVLTIPEDWL